MTETCPNRTVNRELVHRMAISEVLLTGVAPQADGSFLVFAQWPRWHVFYGLREKGFDSALIVETLRQLTILIAHTQMEVPLGMQFIMPHMSVSKTRGAMYDPSRPLDVMVQVQVRDVRRTSRGVAGLCVEADFLIEGRKIGEGVAGARIVDPAAYQRIRSRQSTWTGQPLPTPIDVEMVGHDSPWNVVLGAGAALDRWPLRVDVTNPVLFDHPIDHVPGVLLIEAARQAVRAATGRPELDLQHMDVQFLRIAEFDEGATVVLESLSEGPDEGNAAVWIQADDRILMRAVVGFTSKPAPSMASQARTHHWKPERPAFRGRHDNLHA